MTALAISLAFVAFLAWDAARRYMAFQSNDIADIEKRLEVLELPPCEPVADPTLILREFKRVDERIEGMDAGIANIVGRLAVLEAQPAGDDVLARISRQDDVIVRAVNEMRDLLAPVRNKILGAVPGRAGKDPLAELNGAAR